MEKKKNILLKINERAAAIQDQQHTEEQQTHTFNSGWI